MDLLINLIILFFLFIGFITIKNWEPYILIVPAFLYLTPFANTMPDIFGISFPLAIEFITLLIFSIKIFLEKSISINFFTYQRDATVLLIFFCFLFIDHFLVGSQARLSIRTHSIPPILHLLTIITTIRLSYKHHFDPWSLINICRSMLWINLIFGFYAMFISESLSHENLFIFLSEKGDITFYINNFAIFAVELLIIELAFMRKVNIISILLIILPVIACLLTFSRSGFICLILVIFYWFTFQKKTFFPIVAFPIILIIITTFIDLSFLWERFEIIGDAESLKELKRYKYIERGFQMFLDYPIIGTGVGTFYKYRYMYGEHTLGAFADSHNVYIQILAETGVAGGLLFILFIYHLTKNINKIEHIDPLIYQTAKTILFLFLLFGIFSHEKYMFNFYLPLLVLSYYGGNMISKPKILRSD